MKVTVDLDRKIGDCRRLITRIYEVDKSESFPEGAKFACQYLFFRDKWVEVVRVDNYEHEKRFGTHVHKLGAENAQFIEISVDQLETYVLTAGETIIKRLMLGEI